MGLTWAAAAAEVRRLQLTRLTPTLSPKRKRGMILVHMFIKNITPLTIKQFGQLR
jgi:hypothetical protein